MELIHRAPSSGLVLAATWQGTVLPPTHTPIHLGSSWAFPFFFCHTVLYFSIPLLFPPSTNDTRSDLPLFDVMRSCFKRRI